MLSTLTSDDPSGLQRLLTCSSAAFEAVRRRLWYTIDLRFYACPSATIDALPRPQVLSRDRFEDLQYYERCERDQMTPAEYRRESARRRELGYHLYTLVLDGRLVYYGWLVDRQLRSEDPLMEQVFFPPKDAAIIFDCFTHPISRRKGVYYRALCQMLHDACELASARVVCMGAFGDNQTSWRVIERIGFRYIGSMYKRKRLGLSRRYSNSVDPIFRTALL